MRPISKKRQRENRVRRRMVERLVAERGEQCEAQLEGICDGRSVDPHEVKTRGRGGSIVDDENILLLCRPCHEWVTGHPVGAAERGLLLWSWEDVS